MEAKNPAFAVWITGLPASGKSTITRALKQQLADRAQRSGGERGSVGVLAVSDAANGGRASTAG